MSDDEATLPYPAARPGEPVDPYWPPVATDPAFAQVYPPGFDPRGLDPRPPRRRRKRTVLIVSFVVLALCCVSGVIATVMNQALTGPVQSSAGLNTTVRDGKFEFVVSSMSCAHSTVGKAPVIKRAQGQFCLVNLSVRNIGTQAQTFADNNQKALGPDSTRYTADSGAGLLANPEGTALWNLINPGNAVNAIVVYDIPANAEIAKLELHDSAFSRGVTVFPI